MAGSNVCSRLWMALGRTQVREGWTMGVGGMVGRGALESSSTAKLGLGEAYETAKRPAPQPRTQV